MIGRPSQSCSLTTRTPTRPTTPGSGTSTTIAPSRKTTGRIRHRSVRTGCRCRPRPSTQSTTAAGTASESSEDSRVSSVTESSRSARSTRWCPDYTLLSDGKTDEGDAPMPAARLDVSDRAEHGRPHGHRRCRFAREGGQGGGVQPRRLRCRRPITTCTRLSMARTSRPPVGRASRPEWTVQRAATTSAASWSTATTTTGTSRRRSRRRFRRTRTACGS